MTGFWNSEATSRKMWMLSASRSWMWLRRSLRSVETCESRLSPVGVAFCSTAAVAVMFLQEFEGNKKPAAAGRLRRGVWGIPVSLVVAYPIVRRGAQQHAQQATGMEQQILTGSTIRV